MAMKPRMRLRCKGLSQVKRFCMYDRVQSRCIATFINFLCMPRDHLQNYPTRRCNVIEDVPASYKPLFPLSQSDRPARPELSVKRERIGASVVELVFGREKRIAIIVTHVIVVGVRGEPERRGAERTIGATGLRPGASGRAVHAHRESRG